MSCAPCQMNHTVNCANNARCFCALLDREIGGDKGNRDRKKKGKSSRPGMINPKFSCALICVVNLFLFTPDFLEIFQTIELTGLSDEAKLFRSMQSLLCALHCGESTQEVTHLAGFYKQNINQMYHLHIDSTPNSTTTS